VGVLGVRDAIRASRNAEPHATPSDSAAIMPRSRALGGQTALGLERAVCIEGKNDQSHVALLGS